jgi:transposase
VELARQRLGEGAKRGDLTGPSPTDRAKSGVKRHILTDARGLPIAALITGANVPDANVIGEVLDAVVMRGPRGPRAPNTCVSTRATTTRTSLLRFDFAEFDRTSDVAASRR